MSLDGSRRRVRRILLVVATGLLLAAGCASDGTDAQDSGTDELTDEEVFAAMRAVHPLVGDLPPIPVPAELGARDDDTAKEALRLLEKINAFKEINPLSGLPGGAAPNDKSIRTMKGDGWQERCDAIACYYTKKQGDLTITWTHMWGLPSVWHSFLEWDGCDGEHEYDDFMLEDWYIYKDLKYAIYTYYQYPDPPPCADGKAGIGPGPAFRWFFELIEGGTLYTPGQVNYLDTRRYITEQWVYDSTIGEYVVFHMLVCTHYPDDRLVFEHYTRRASNPRLIYLWYRGVWGRDYKYCWTTYREDQTVLACGGDMGCPDCGP